MNESTAKSLTTNNGTERKRSYSTSNSFTDSFHSNSSSFYYSLNSSSSGNYCNNSLTTNLKSNNIPPSSNNSSSLQQQQSNSFHNNKTIIKEQRTRSKSNNTESNLLTIHNNNNYTPRKKWNKEEYPCENNNPLKTIPCLTNTSYSNLNASTFYSLPNTPRDFVEIDRTTSQQRYTLKSFTDNKSINKKDSNKLNKTSGNSSSSVDNMSERELSINNEIVESIERQKKRNLKLIEELYSCNEHYAYLQNILNNLNKNSNINNMHYITENLVDIITYFNMNIYKNNSVLTTSDIITTKKKNSINGNNNLIENNKLLSTFVQIVQLFLKKLTEVINNEKLKKFVFIYQPVLISSFQQLQNYNNDLLNLLQIIVNEC